MPRSLRGPSPGAIGLQPPCGSARTTDPPASAGAPLRAPRVDLVNEIDQLVSSGAPQTSLARKRPSSRRHFRLGLVQERWHPDPAEHQAALGAGIRRAAAQGAQLVCLQELTLSRYFAVDPGG